MAFQLTNEFISRFQRALDDCDDAFIIESLEEVNAVDISALLNEFDPSEGKYVLKLLPHNTQSLVIRDFDTDNRREILKDFESVDVARLVSFLDSDDAADILNELPILQREDVLLSLDEEYRNKVTDLLRYPENVAGGLMAKELIKVRGHWTVVHCAKEIRKQAINVSKFYAAYVVDEHDRLLGLISLQQLVLADLRTNVRDLIEDELVSVETYMEDKEVASIMKKYDLESIPVVNHGRLVGRITIDDVLDVITEQAEEERQIMSGITEDVEEDDSIWLNTRARLPWLVIGILGGIVNARFMGLFEYELSRITAIAFFIPLIQATGGNVGIQSASLVVQSLAGDGLIDARLWTRLGKVFAVAILNGFVLALLVFGANFYIYSDQSLSSIVSYALFAVVIFASLVGTVTPLLLHRIGINPAMASGPFITTINDLLGLSIYFLTIRLLL